MAFDIITWSIGWTLGKLGESIIKALTPSELRSRLAGTIESWAQALPRERYVEPRAIFARAEPEPGPARRLLFERLIDSALPTEDEWHRALVERWQAVRIQSGDLQPFFLLPESEASADLRKLAARLTAVCTADERMYRNATVGLRDRIRDWQNGTPVISVNEIEDPERWSSSCSVGFHLHNSTESALLVSNLRAFVEEATKIDRFAAKTPGAPINEYRFKVSLVPSPGAIVKLTPLGASRFNLKPDETEFFRVEIQAVLGWDYVIRLGADTMRLHDAQLSKVQTAGFCLSFENQS